jgi:hypothetical protein
LTDQQACAVIEELFNARSSGDNSTVAGLFEKLCHTEYRRASMLKEVRRARKVIIAHTGGPAPAPASDVGSAANPTSSLERQPLVELADACQRRLLSALSRIEDSVRDRVFDNNAANTVTLNAAFVVLVSSLFDQCSQVRACARCAFCYCRLLYVCIYLRHLR